LTGLGIAGSVVAPALIPVRVGDRVKTDRRDAENLARCHRQGVLAAFWVPSTAAAASRSLKGALIE
jgi:transposase